MEPQTGLANATVSAEKPVRGHDHNLARQTRARFRLAGNAPWMEELRVAVLRYRLQPPARGDVP
ncbi:MAG: hypothetical protein ACOY3X_11990 [Pseudomonadota bacterium]